MSGVDMRHCDVASHLPASVTILSVWPTERGNNLPLKHSLVAQPQP